MAPAGVAGRHAQEGPGVGDDGIGVSEVAGHPGSGLGQEDREERGDEVSRSAIPGLYVEAGFNPRRVKVAVSVIRRIPNWILYEIHEFGMWDDLWSTACIPLLYEDGDLRRLYNAAQREVYRFLKEVGYRKVRWTNPATGKVNSIWRRCL